MACRLFGAKSMSELMMDYFRFHPWEQISFWLGINKLTGNWSSNPDSSWNAHKWSSATHDTFQDISVIYICTRLTVPTRQETFIHRQNGIWFIAPPLQLILYNRSYLGYRTGFPRVNHQWTAILMYLESSLNFDNFAYWFYIGNSIIGRQVVK